MIIATASVNDTRAFGARVAAQARPGDIYALEGDLGTGKTEFVRGFVGSLDPEIIVRSPSFSIVNTYRAPCYPVYHFDFYRLNEAGELHEIGFDEYVSAADGVCLVEWGTMFPSVLPPHTRTIRFSDKGTIGREIEYDFDVAGSL
jgi:tRNA threonylcarbamoyladenosine biosynthesis protein TsaE